MSTDRTITEEDLDPETRKFVQELSDRQPGQDAALDGAPSDEADRSSIDSFFSE